MAQVSCVYKTDDTQHDICTWGISPFITYMYLYNYACTMSVCSTPLKKGGKGHKKSALVHIYDKLPVMFTTLWKC